MRIRQFALLLAFLVASATAPAQVQYNPYFGWFSGSNQVTFTDGSDGIDVYDAQQYAVGIDLLFGAGHWAPAAGLLFRPGRYTRGTAEDFSLHRVHLPVGIAYRVLSPVFDMNLIPSVALVPGFTFGSDLDSARTLDLSARVGLRIYADWLTLGVNYFVGFTDHFGSGEHEAGRTLYTLGIRF